MKNLILWGSVGGLFVLILKLLKDLDVNKVVFSHRPGSCHYISGIEKGSEDVVLLKDGRTLITSGIYFFTTTPSSSPGHVYIFDANQPDSKAVELTLVSEKGFEKDTFHPSGIAVWESRDETLVYVVNSYDATIIVFTLNSANGSLNFVKTLSDPLLTNPNNLVVVDKDKFFVTNFLYFNPGNPILMNLELSLQLSLGSLLYYDGSKFHLASTGLKGPNGLAASNDGKFLYMSLLLAEELLVYRILPNRTLELVQEVPLYTGGDNINVDYKGNIWVGAHPIMYQVAMHMFNPKDYSSPSQILKVSFTKKDHSEWEIEEVLADSGRMIKASTVALPWKDGIIIGTMFHPPVWCELK